MSRRASTKQNQIEENTVSNDEIVPDFTDLDVDAPETVETTEDTVAEAPVAGEKTEKVAKAPARPPVPEGKVSPVAFAKILSEHLIANGRLEEGKSVAPQVVYSYIKNNGPESKNPFPAEKAEG